MYTYTYIYIYVVSPLHYFIMCCFLSSMHVSTSSLRDNLPAVGMVFMYIILWQSECATLCKNNRRYQSVGVARASNVERR